jgi:molybdate transport system ATP-binding protein
MCDFFLRLESLNVTIGGQKILSDINFQINPGQSWVICGQSGSGKTVLARVLAGRQFYTGTIRTAFGDPDNFFQQIYLVEQQHRFQSVSRSTELYYQQRFNSGDAEQTITVEQELAGLTGEEPDWHGPLGTENLLSLLKIRQLLDVPLIQLSNGESKRVQLAKAILKNPVLMVLDQPFLGLDPEGRKLLHELLHQLHQSGQQLLLISSRQEIPEYCSHVAHLQKGSIQSCTTKKEYLATQFDSAVHFNRLTSLSRFANTRFADFAIAIRMVDATVRYGKKEILSHVNWTLRRGERCCITGPNGAGKSTLLSLVSADNPQAYASEIYLFDRRRGTGESIWDIKKKIGLVSPEMHLHFNFSATCFETVASGLFDTIGLFRRLNPEQEQQVLEWMDCFELLDKKDFRLSQLPAGSQRLVLLVRALIKKPPLLLLDEPCQGLDDDQTAYFKNLIDQYCNLFKATLVYVSHYLKDVPSSVDHFLQMEAGKLVGCR